MQSLPFFDADGGTARNVHSAIRDVIDEAVNITTGSTSHPAFSAALPEFITRSASGLGSADSVNASAVLAMQQRHTIQVMATATSSVSITATICAMYWFCMMRRNFRRDLVLLLITGDFFKTIQYLIFSVVTFSRGPVSTTSNFCQASGFMLQVGLQACGKPGMRRHLDGMYWLTPLSLDLAIFTMSLHMCLQIFPPSRTLLGHDGLYRIRHWVIAAWFLIPNFSAALAFVNAAPAYQSVGPFCWLPIRPYWYRLALSWIPRYLIWLFTIGVAIRIYRHVGKEFRVFGRERDRSSSLAMPGESSIDRAALADTIRRRSVASGTVDVEKQGSNEDVAPDDTSMNESQLASKHSPPGSTKSHTHHSSRRPSAPEWPGTFGFTNESLVGSQLGRSNPNSRRGSRQMAAVAAGVFAEDFAPPTNYEPSRHRGSITTLASIRSTTAPSSDATPALPPISEDKRASNATKHSNTAQNVADQVVWNRGRAIQRQLRLLFIYPVVYSILWAIPFVYHGMNYNNYYAQHPIYVIGVLNTFCQCFLGFVDVCVFSWREKPWRHIPGSDGTFTGSFCFWRFCWGGEWAEAVRRESRAPSNMGEEETEEAENEKSQSQTGLLASLKRWSLSRKGSSPRQSEGSVTVPRPIRHRRTRSGGSDRKHLEVDRAHERLALERAEWEQNRRSLHERRESVIEEKQAAGQQPAPERKEWWDRHMSADLFHDDLEHGVAKPDNA